MIPFCRTPEECQKVIATMESHGLKRGDNGLQVYLMCEIPSNVIEADLFSPLIDGVSIGGNDLLQLILGVDRDSDKISYLSQDDNTSYRRMITSAIKTYQSNNVKVGFCGQQPSDNIEFCKFLIALQKIFHLLEMFLLYLMHTSHTRIQHQLKASLIFLVFDCFQHNEELSLIHI